MKNITKLICLFAAVLFVSCNSPESNEIKVARKENEVNKDEQK